MSVQSRYAHCAGYEVHYMDWGTTLGPDAPVVVAWHGLARTGRDMDALAQFLVGQGFRVICPDTIGRGFSQWSRDPKAEYCLRFYARLARELFDVLGIARAHWVGTSMGGAIGTVCASGLFEPSMRGRIASLVLNDNAPQLADAAIERIKSYAGTLPVFDTLGQLEQFFRAAYAPFGWLSDAEWRKLTETSTRRLSNGRVTPHYDPAITQQFTEHHDDYRLWAHYDVLDLPVTLLRGVDSDLVLAPTAREMQTRGPGARGLLEWVEVPGCGHAPALNVQTHFDAVLRCLRRG
ncbi:alpha/beta fold hydrolase [Diaphorobacter aerolatus]|uniref:Alpha/beta hydrolase n=1 Tax=Diaphorobacter aerolatus TaxID=1288495 RepID=A0A7H0GJQ1_9BURK|nr:alpha/beta hydrolase [Diaphorobacter aerolatus]QNP48517.1 alpha/beta hydrolase [Diaphorobacter aerolatus]